MKMGEMFGDSFVGMSHKPSFYCFSLICWCRKGRVRVEVSSKVSIVLRELKTSLQHD